MVLPMANAVRGLTKQAAPSTGEAPSGRTRTSDALALQWVAHVFPVRTATTLPRSACAASDAPAATTTPAPSLPTSEA